MLMNIPTPAQPHSPLCLAVNRLLLLSREGKRNKMGNFVVFFLKLGQLIQQCSLSGTISLKNPPTPQGTSLKDFPINTIHPTFKQNVCMSNQLLIHYTEWKYMYVFLKSLISYLSPPPRLIVPLPPPFCLLLLFMSIIAVGGSVRENMPFSKVYSVVHLTDKLKKGHFLLQTVMYKVFDMNVNSMIKKPPKQTAVFSSSIVTLFPSCRKWRECR